MKLILFFFRFAWSLFVVLTPALGFWVSSSLAAYLNGPIWLAYLTGALLFPIGPLLWELRGIRKSRQKQRERQQKGLPPKERILTFWDRMTLRTLSLNLLFLGAILYNYPKEGFTALSTRGDWMLQNNSGPEVEQTREILFYAAGGLEWLYDISRNNPYRDLGPDDQDPDPDGIVDSSDVVPLPPEEHDGRSWPLPDTMHPLIDQMPASANQSYVSAAQYIANNESDPFQRVKALHDYVADRIAYDFDGLNDGSYVRKQDVQTVWSSKKGVCAGYAKLMVAMGKVTGDNIVYVTGDARDLGGNVDGNGHAWNAVQIEGSWYLMDVTWDAGSTSDGSTFEQKYKTTYFLTPPATFGLNHFPDQPSWQLRRTPLSRGEFIRQPLLTPAFYKLKMELLDPKRSQISVSQPQVTLTLDNPPQNRVFAELTRKGRPKKTACSVTGTTTLTIDCPIPNAGTYHVQLFASRNAKAKTFPFVGQIEVNY